MQRIVLFVVLVLLTVGMSAPARAGDRWGRGAPAEPSSVFPAPRDPWRSWGVRRGGGEHFREERLQPMPRHRHPPATAIWVPGRWVWNGAQWQWWPGFWTRD